MKSQMTIGKKLFLSIGSALALTLGVCLMAQLSISNLGSAIDNAINKGAKKQFLAAVMDGNESDILSAERAIVLRALTKESALMEKMNREFSVASEGMKQNAAEFVKLVETDEVRRQVDELQKGMEKMVRNHQELYALAAGNRTTEAAAFLVARVIPDSDEVNALTKRMVDSQTRQLAETAKSAQASVSQARWVMTILMGFSLLVGLVVVLIVRHINRTLLQAVTELSTGADQTASAASQVSSSSQSLAQGSSEQAASLEETSASSEEINSMARKNTENSRTAAQLVTQSQEKFAQTNQALEQTVVAMSEIDTQSGKISKIIKVIDEIAFQTNILALNAAVEAARAGEAGMGFAVVADEVRNLAQRCAQAAKDTAELIEESVAKSKDGKSKVDQVAVAIRAITEEQVKVKTLVDEVNVGSQEQAKGIEQIGKALTQMEQVTQTTAANAEESASAAEELTAQSETLKDVVARLTAMVSGAGEVRHSPSSPSRAAEKRRPAGIPSHHAQSASGLSAMRAAVSRESNPLVASAKVDKNAFPMEEEFQEF